MCLNNELVKLLVSCKMVMQWSPESVLWTLDWYWILVYSTKWQLNLNGTITWIILASSSHFTAPVF